MASIVKARGELLRRSAGPRNRMKTVQTSPPKAGKVVCLLFQFVSLASLCSVAPAEQLHAGTDPGSLEAQEVHSIALRSASGMTAPDNHSAVELRGIRPQKLVVIGFVGGFARHDDRKHPEVQFAEYLRDRYASEVFAEVFGNHHGKKALHEVLQLLDTDGNGALSPHEKAQAKIVLYGHSWGAAETVIFARELKKREIPVLVTFQIDSIVKPGRDDSTIPANVKQAINLYQSRGPLHGRPQIFAADPARTTIIGNFQLTYEDHSINCDNYPWYARTFNKPHHEIENDPRVWNLAESLIESEVAGPTQMARNPTWTPVVK